MLDNHDRLNQHTAQSAEYHDHHCRPKSSMYAGKTMSSTMTKVLLPGKVICHVQVIGGGQYRHACDHNHGHQDAVKPDTPTTDVGPAIPEPLPALPSAKTPAGAAAPIAPTTPLQTASAAATNTPHKPPPAVHTPHCNSKYLPLELHQSRLAQHLLPLTDQLAP